MQTVLLSMFVDRSEDSRIMISEIARYAGCRTTKILRLSDEIDVLEAKRYLRASRSSQSLSYRVPSDVLKSLRDNKPYVYTEDSIPDTSAFFDRFNRLINEKECGEQTYDSLLSRTEEMLEEIRSTAFASRLRTYVLDKCDTLLFIFMAHLYVENFDDNIRFHDIQNIFDNGEIPSGYKYGLRNRTSALFRHGLIENVNENGMAYPYAFKLTEKAKEELLCELDFMQTIKSHKGLIKALSLIHI